MKVQALIDITIPGTIHSVHDSGFVKELIKKLPCDSMFVDTVPCWGCLDQDWLEFQTTIDTNWGWVGFPDFDDAVKKEILDALHHGVIVMMVRIKTDDPENPWEPYV